MVQMLAPEVRSQFAQRLKNLRTQRGFDRARYFAKSLGIEENRYTRYERAEVEPSLTLIHKMCETLRVSPNELLGFSDVRFAYSGGVAGTFGAWDGGAVAGAQRGRRRIQGGGSRGHACLEPRIRGGGHPPIAGDETQNGGRPSRRCFARPECCSGAFRQSRSPRWPRSSTTSR